MARNESIQCLCIFCFEPFVAEESEYENGHQKCGENYEAEANRRWAEELIAMCPPGTRFDMGGGAACD